MKKILLILLLLLFTTSASAGITFIQKVPNSTTPVQTLGASSIVTGNFTSTGNSLLVAICTVYVDSLTTPTITFSDNKGNSWTTYVTQKRDATTSSIRTTIGYAIATTAGANHTVTATPSDTADMDLGVLEFSGVDTTTPAAGSNSATGSSTTPSSGALNAGGLYVGACNWNGGPGTITNTWTSSTLAFSDNDSTYAMMGGSYYIATGSQTFSLSHTTSRPWVACIAGFTPSATAVNTLLTNCSLTNAGLRAQ